MDKFKGLNVNKSQHLSADDVPPTELWKSTGKVANPKRNYYYEMKYEPLTKSFLNKMATPFNNVATKQPVTKEQVKVKTAQGPVTGGDSPMPHCKACTDFKTWMKLTANPRRDMPKTEREEKQCPLDSELLGSNTWSFLHTMAAYYPEKPTFEQQHNMKSFITLLSQFYPCHICAAHLREDLKTNKPDTSNNTRLSTWFCNVHNRVNERLGKPLFDCSKVMERWRDGWADNSCD